MARKFFNHNQFNFELQFAMGGVHYGAGDLGEMLSTADRIVDGDPDSWCQEWIATGQRVATIAEECTKSDHSVSCRAAYLRAASYFAVALSSAAPCIHCRRGRREASEPMARSLPEQRMFDWLDQTLAPLPQPPRRNLRFRIQAATRRR